MATWLVTGASGFFGYFMCKKIVETGEVCVGVDINPFEYEDLKEKVEFYKVDIRDKGALEGVFKKKIDYVIHAAAALPRFRVEDIVTTNFYGTKNLLELSKKYKVKRFVFISSTAVYGKPKKEGISEDYPLNPINAYAYTKVFAEKLCEVYRKYFDVLILRPKTFVGPLRLGIFSIIFDLVYTKTPLPIPYRGRNLYQLLDVRDLVEITYALTKNSPKEVFNDVYNVGAKKFGSVAKLFYSLILYEGEGRLLPTPYFLLKPVLRILDKLKLLPIYEWAYETIDKNHYVSTKKLEEKAKLVAKISSERALLDSYAWYKKHRKEFIGKKGLTHRVQWYSKGLEVAKLLLKVFKYI